MALPLPPSSSVTSQFTKSEESPRSFARRHDSVEGPSTLVDKYELVGAVPTRILKPASMESRFTCYAFSSEGDRFVTGETDGTIRLWRTSSYELIGTHTSDTCVPVSTVSFFGTSSEQLVAVDKEGRVWMMKFERQGNSSAASSLSAAALSNMRRVGFGKLESNYSNFLTHQFSKDGRVLAHFRGENDPETNTFTFSGADVYNVEDGPDELQCTCIEAQAEGFDFSVPVLSKNGRSLLVCSFRRDEETNDAGVTRESYETDVSVIPRIDHHAESQTTIGLNGQHASWGLDGEYLLVWDRDCGRPRLRLYKTEEIAEKGHDVKPFAKKILDFGLFDYKAQVLESQNNGATVKVLIYEITENEKRRLRRFFIWDTKSDTVSSEVQMNLYQVNKVDSEQWLMTGKTADQLVEIGFPTKSHEDFYCRVMADVFPRFCASNDKNWIGAFSWRRHGGGISSMSTGVTTWKFRLPDCVKMDPFLLPNHVLFDSKQNHLMIFADSGIFACRPDFLHPSVTPAEENSSNRRYLSFSDQIGPVDKENAERWDVLPSAAFVRKYSMKLESQSRKHSLLYRKSKQRVFDRIIDVFQSADASLTAMIAEDTNRERPIVVSVSETGNEFELEQNYHLRFPMNFSTFDEPFRPARIFLFGRSGHERIVLFPDSEEPVIIFCTGQLGQLIPVCLDMNKCLDVCMSEDRKQLLILDICGVCFLNLRQKRIERRIAYKVDFDGIMALLPGNVWWRRKGPVGERVIHTERRISDNGKAVLLGWDTNNGKSITVKPTTEQSECEMLIQQAGKRLSDYCALSASGASTSFLDVDDLMNGKITVGIFNERVKKVVFNFHIAENVPLSLTEEQKISLVSNVFYGVSRDGNELVTITLGLQQYLPHASQIDDKVRVFNIYGADDCIPTYDQLTLKRFTSIERTFKRLHDEHGVSAFSAPSSDGLSLFQKAFLTENKQVVESIKKFAKEHECLLAVEWTSQSAEGSRCNLLGEALKTMSPGLIKEAVETLGSDVVPFGNAARIMKEHFHELVEDNLDVLQDALSQNLFVTYACSLDVHVNFMDPQHRRDTADYMGATDTFLDWKHNNDNTALKENWKLKNAAVIQSMESTGNTSTTEAALNFIKIEDAAKTGMNGILRPLLLRRVPVNFFEFDVVKWVVLFKWFTIWRKRFLAGLCWYVAFLGCFASYALILSKTPEVSTADAQRKTSLSCLLGVTFLFSGRMALEEWRQLMTYREDGMQRRQTKPRSGDGRLRKRLAGHLYYLGFKWNWIDLASCTLVLAIITPLHCASLFHKHVEDWLASFVAIEAILAFAKVWYFAQPFQHTGPLVRMIYNIVWDSSVFLGLALVVMLGFGVGLPPLFRKPSGTDEDREDVHNAYGQFRYSLQTLFFALVGNFNPTVYSSAGNLSWLATFVFITYLLTQMILLLNLLISIMGDTFDRVKGTEEAHLLMGRAMFIDACEAALSRAECKKIDDGIGKYLHVLTKVGEAFGEKPTTEWCGKLERIENNCREVIQSSERNIKDLIEGQSKNITTIGQQLMNLRDSLFNRPREDEEEVSHTPGKIDILEERLSTVEHNVRRASERIDELFDLVKTTTSERLDELVELLKAEKKD